MLPKRTRLKTFDYLGPYRYFLTFCTAGRHRAFTNGATVDFVLAQIQRAAAERGSAIIAYCFMPDHVHLQVEGTGDDSDLRVFCRLSKQYSGFRYKQATARQLWQPSYYEHVLRDDEDTYSVVRYIVENPLIANLAQRADKYPFLGSCSVDKTALLRAAACAPPWERG
jgi:putative transposase